MARVIKKKPQSKFFKKLKKSEKKLNFFQPAQKTVLDCKASLKQTEIIFQALQQLGLSPEQLEES